MTSNWATVDLCDRHADKLTIAAPALRSFGGKRRFDGAIATVRCFVDSSLVRERLAEPGNGRVLVVDGGGSMKCALVGDQLGALGGQRMDRHCRVGLRARCRGASQGWIWVFWRLRCIHCEA
jgi:regulator of RNase E activity RraA